MMIDFDKYNPLKKIEVEQKVENKIQKAEVAKIDSWIDSHRIVILSWFVKERAFNLMSIVEYEGLPCVLFRPGLSIQSDAEDWRKVSYGLDLFDEALPDMIALMESGRLWLPPHPKNGSHPGSIRRIHGTLHYVAPPR